MYCMALIFIILNILLSSLEAVPINTTTYDALVDYSSKKCPYLMTTRLLKPKPSYLVSCPKWSTIHSISNLTRESAYDASCLLYVNNFISLCNVEVDLKPFITNDTIDKVSKLYNLTSACNVLQNTNVRPEFKSDEKIIAMLKKPNVCGKICSEIITEEVTPICSFAAYSLHLVYHIQETLEKDKSNMKENTKSHDVSDTADVHKSLAQESKPAPEVNPVVKTAVLKPENVINSVQAAAVDSKPLPSNKEETHEVKPSPNQHTNGQTQTAENTPTQSVSSKELTSETHTDEAKKTEPAITGNEEVQSDSQATNKNQDGQETGTGTDEKPAVGDNKKNLEISDSKQIPQESKVEKGQNGEKPPPSDPNEKGKDVGQMSPPVKDSSGKENPVQPGDDAELDGDTNNIDGSEDGNPPSDDDLIDKGEPEPEPETPVNKKAEKPETSVIKKAENDKPTKTKPEKTDEDVGDPLFKNSNIDEEDSFFFIYFMMVCALFILGYIGYHNKQKVLALVIEGRRGRRGSRRGRPNSANYHKLDSNLEEAVTSSCNKNTTNIIY